MLKGMSPNSKAIVRGIVRLSQTFAKAASEAKFSTYASLSAGSLRIFSISSCSRLFPAGMGCSPDLVMRPGR
jgi:hypothetical protein